LMRGTCILSAIVWLAGVAAASAQANQTPGMGITSPLGTLSDSSSPSGTIPLGATELNPPGLSPLVMPCPNTVSNAQFDGGGSSLSSGCGSATANSSFGGSAAASNSSTLTSGLMAGSNNGSGIPLGATDLGTPGESQNIVIPNMSVAPCSSSTSGTSMITPSNGIASAGGC
jgi:hypothetical protein